MPVRFAIPVFALAVGVFGPASAGDAPAFGLELEPADGLDPDAVHAYDFDRLVLRDGTALWGEVQIPVTSDGWEILLVDPKTEDPEERERQRHTRVAVLPVGRVRAVDWSVVNQYDMLRHDRRNGLLTDAQYRAGQADLADFAFRHRAVRPEYAELARRLYLQVAQVPDTPSAPGDIHRRLGRLFDEIDPADAETRAQALARFEAHLRRFPADAEALAAVERLRALLAAAEEPAKETSEDDENAEETAAAPTHVEGFERATWSWMLDGVEPTDEMRQYLVPQHLKNRADNNNIVLKLPYLGLPGKDKKVIYQLNATRTQNFAESSALAMVAYLKPDVPAVRVAIALSTGNYEWFESEAVTLPATGRFEPKPLRFDVKRPRWKTRATNWNHTTAVQNLDNVRAIYILVFNNPEDRGEIYVDAIRFE